VWTHPVANKRKRKKASRADGAQEICAYSRSENRVGIVFVKTIVTKIEIK